MSHRLRIRTSAHCGAPQPPRRICGLPVFLVVVVLCAATPLACGGGTGFTGDASDVAADGADTSADSHADADAPVDSPMDHPADDLDGSIPGCGAQDAWASGDCAMELPGIVWNGESCVYLGSGCGCAGDDCDVLYDTVAACAAEHLECYGVGCDPMPVADDTCIACYYPTLQGTAWTGTGCADLVGCGCAGEGCVSMFSSTEECETVQASCDSVLCTATGGDWLPATPCGPCGNYECGLPPPETCCDAGCDCGPYRSFVPGTGCAIDPSCEKEQACVATGGSWYPADPCGPCGDLHCGEPNMLPCCDAGCDCGPGRSFAEGVGCSADPSCSPTRADLCTGTGGTWFPAAPCGPCGDYTCGIPSLDDCCDAGCDCGALRVYETGVGCVWSAECTELQAGESCTGSGAYSNCAPGLVCCATCGMMAHCSYCQAPCCPDDVSCMEDGCPPPPP